MLRDALLRSAPQHDAERVLLSAQPQKGTSPMAQPTAQRAERKGSPPIAGEAFLRALADHGVDYFFANPGTDFPPIVEAFSRSKLTNARYRRRW